MRRVVSLFPMVLASIAPAAAQTVPEPGQVLAAAVQTAQAIDQGKAGQIWDGASQVMKSSIPKERFVALIAQARARDGGIQKREWQSVNKVHMTAAKPNLPVGEYLSVTFAGIKSNSSISRESITFVLDADRVWRLAGYSIQ